VSSTGLEGARIALLVGAGIGAALYLLLVYALHSYMVKNFDMMVRRLAGAR
jgi:hypothetical protein